MTDLLLFNGFTPLRRSPADVFLDNGIGMLRTALDEAGIQFIIDDPTTLNEMRAFEEPEISTPLRKLFKKQMFDMVPLSETEEKESQQLYGSLVEHNEQKVHQYLDNLTQTIVDRNIPIVGIKLWAGSTFNFAVYLCEQIHLRAPNTIVIVGGPQVNCYSFEGQILSLTPFDVAVYSEGEAALVSLVKICSTLPTKEQKLRAVAAANIPNTIFRTEEGIYVSPIAVVNVNEKRIPEYGDMEGKVAVHTVVDALGCDYAKCSFCVHPKIYPLFRTRTPALIVDEMEHMVKRGVGLFSFTASDTPLSHGEKIGQEILNRNLTVEFTMLTRAKRNAAKHKDKIIDQFRTIIRAGLKSVFFGVESANNEVLKHVMNKGITADDIAETMDCLRKASTLENRPVNIIASFIYPVPLPDKLLEQGISQKSVLDDNLHLLKRIQPDSFHSIPGLLYPGTEWYKRAAEFNIQFDINTFSQHWIKQEFSTHGLITQNQTSFYSFDDLAFTEMIPLAIEFNRKGNDMGFPSDLWEEQFIFARACKIEGKKSLIQLSEDLLLDLLVCNDEKTRYLYEETNRYSRRIAHSNIHLFSSDGGDSPLSSDK